MSLHDSSREYHREFLFEFLSKEDGHSSFSAVPVAPEALDIPGPKLLFVGVRSISNGMSLLPTMEVIVLQEFQNCFSFHILIIAIGLDKSIRIP